MDNRETPSKRIARQLLESTAKRIRREPEDFYYKSQRIARIPDRWGKYELEITRMGKHGTKSCIANMEFEKHPLLLMFQKKGGEQEPYGCCIFCGNCIVLRGAVKCRRHVVCSKTCLRNVVEATDSDLGNMQILWKDEWQYSALPEALRPIEDNNCWNETKILTWLEGDNQCGTFRSDCKTCEADVFVDDRKTYWRGNNMYCSRDCFVWGRIRDAVSNLFEGYIDMPIHMIKGRNHYKIMEGNHSTSYEDHRVYQMLKKYVKERALKKRTARYVKTTIIFLAYKEWYRMIKKPEEIIKNKELYEKSIRTIVNEIEIR